MIFSLECDYDPYSEYWNPVVLWHPEINDPRTYNIHDIELKKQINQASSLTFSMGPQHPEYSKFDPRGCMGITIALRMNTSNEFLFYGRVATVDTDIWHIKKITCEGAYAFLNDIMLRPVTFAASDEKGGYYSITQYGHDTMSWADYAYYVFGKYRKRMGTLNGCWKRVVELAELNPIPGKDSTDPTAIKRYSGIDNYTPVIDAVNDIIGTDNRMISRIYTEEDLNTHIITPRLFVDTVGRQNLEAVFSLDFNIINVSESGNGFDIFTSIIPLAKNKVPIDVTLTTSDPEMHRSEYEADKERAEMYDANDFIMQEDSWGQEWRQKNGYIEKVVEFNDIEIKPDHYSDDDPETGLPDVDTEARYILDRRARDVLNEFGNTGIREFSVNAVDLALLWCAGREPFTANTVHHIDETTGNPVYLNELIHENNLINIGDRVYFTNEEYGITANDNWICTSLSMSIDDQADTNYTFSIVDEHYVPVENTLLAQQKWANKDRFNQKADEANIQPSNVIKIDANHVVEMYPDREIHYVADGEGDVRTNIRSYEMPINTTDPTNPHPETTSTDSGS